MSAQFSIERYQELLQTAWLGRTLIYQPVVDSTMNIARTLAREAAANGTVVLAEEQQAGRGRLGRRWLSPNGVNLYFSILLRPDLPHLRTLSIVAPLAIVEGLGALAGVECTIKWPNDVQIDGKKLAGVLLESESSGDRPLFAVAGIGLNVNFDTSDEPEIATIATSLLRETGVSHERERVLAACLDALERCYQEPSRLVHARWRARLNTLGQQIRVVVGDQIEEGIAEDVSDDGSLILRRRDGSRLTLSSGEVSLRA